MVSIEASITTSVNHEFDLLNMHIDKNDLLIPASPILFCLFQPCLVSVTAMQKYDLELTGNTDKYINRKTINTVD